ncbi:ZYRO0E02024p [Zygosaccharomyces rouxii]|uniref:ZYRO0E02024p n=1 Tax=Zygosaccharomyces rouxii (strain ATCC 2623 / CBS 732 / NBRC 1130 / NCYC 568 / NRRL Y-229) TaxID=559307 RepID=C5E419_ZYGRC|nr:uncharacterized protein ZYRO0E02024g [Zygosaccharomyces rouxii]KAH9198360.1 hypothetical protein LQ764DRAFT_157757 [Zygosaccharomyces rouxii]CAR30780.1 ZYRO0E02024p [Zygosaccharomyces rouxii]
MEKFKPLIDEWAAKVSAKVRTEPTNVIHLPSFLLGCFVTVTIFSLIPVMKLFLGSLLSTVVTLLKYLVIGGGIIACIMVITTRGGEDTSKSKSLRHDKQELLPKKEQIPKVKPTAVPQPLPQATVYPPHDGSGLVKDDFEGIRHCDISIASSQHQNRRKVPTDERAYNSFINRAAMKNVAG